MSNLNHLVNDATPLGVLIIDTNQLTICDKNAYIDTVFPRQFQVAASLLDDLSLEDFLLLKQSLSNASYKTDHYTFLFRIKALNGNWKWSLWRVPCPKVANDESSFIPIYVLSIDHVEGFDAFKNFNFLLDIKIKNANLNANRNEHANSIVTERELEVLQLIAEGKRDKEISDILFISNYTTMNHRRNLLKKLQAKNKVELVKIAREHSII